MKRSQMIMELATALIEMDHTFTYGVAQDIVDTILDKAEELGMLPPFHHYDSNIPLTIKEYSRTLADCGLDDYTRNWEEETEN